MSLSYAYQETPAAATEASGTKSIRCTLTCVRVSDNACSESLHAKLDELYVGRVMQFRNLQSRRRPLAGPKRRPSTTLTTLTTLTNDDLVLLRPKTVDVINFNKLLSNHRYDGIVSKLLAGVALVT